MEQKKEMLTTEPISKRFKSQFELVTYSIKLAENMIRTGRGPRVKTDVQNVSHQILLEILNNLDSFEDTVVPKVEVKQEVIIEEVVVADKPKAKATKKSKAAAAK